MDRFGKKEKIVLIGVVKSRRDMELMQRQHWYRMPERYAPLRRYSHIAFYQPAPFGAEGKRIAYVAKVQGWDVQTRMQLIPGERGHPHAGDPYVRVRLGRIQRLQKPVLNTTSRRVVFAFTTLRILKSVRNMLDVFRVVPTEVIIGRMLRHMRVRAIPQYGVKCGSKRFRLDFAVVTRKIAIECDNIRAHSGAAQKRIDAIKTLLLSRHGWKVLRFTDRAVLKDLNGCAQRIRKALTDG